MTYFCSKCVRYFIHQRAFEQHNDAKHQNEFCYKCNRHFVNARALEQHSNAVHPRVYCYKCDEWFNGNIEEHETTYHEDDDITGYCDRCEEVIYGDPEEHETTYHENDDITGYCDRCEEVIYGDPEEHEELCKPDEDQDSDCLEFCHECDEWFDDLEEHENTHHRENDDIGYCGICDGYFYGDPEDHYELCKPEDQDSDCLEFCDECDQWFDDLEEHIEAYHPKDPHCLRCNRSFITEHALSQHNAAVHRTTPSPSTVASSCPSSNEDEIYCEPCDAFVATGETLAHHNATLHGCAARGQTYCSDCGRDFINSYALNQHRGSSVHAYCYRCKRWFTGKDECDAHRALSAACR